MPTLVEIREEIAAKSKALHEIFVQAGPERDMAKVTLIEGDSKGKAEEIKRRNDELTALGKQRDELTDWDAMQARADAEYRAAHAPGTGMTHPTGKQHGATPGAAPAGPTGIDLARMFAESKEFAAFRDDPRGRAVLSLPDVEAKTLITLTTVSPQNERRDAIGMAREERTVIDMMVQGRVNTPVMEYYEQTTFTNAAAETAEGGTKPEGALAWTLRTANLRDIAWWIPLTRQALADNDFLEAQVRGELVFGVRRREETQVLTGDGTPPNLRGILNTSGIQTQAKGTDPVPDAVYKAMQLVRGAAGAGFAEPTGAVFHPLDWQDIRLLRTADGIYIWGSPADEGPERIWSLPVRQTTAITQNTGLVGAFRPYAQFLRKGGVDIIMSSEHSTYVIENKILLLAEERAMFLVTRASAFATVTGI